MNEQEFQQKINDLQNYLETYGKTAEYFIQKGNLLAQIGEYEQAIQDFKNAIMKEPNHIDALLGLGESYMCLNQIDYALLSFGKAAKILKDSGHRTEAQNLIDSVLNIDDLSPTCTQFFHQMINDTLRSFIIISSSSYTTNGLSRGEELANALAEIGHTVHYITVPENGKLEKDTFDISKQLQTILNSKYTKNLVNVYAPVSSEQVLLGLCIQLANTCTEPVYMFFCPLSDGIAHYLGSRYCVVLDHADSYMYDYINGQKNMSMVHNFVGHVTCSSSSLFLRTYFLKQVPNTIYLSNGVNVKNWNNTIIVDEPEELSQIPHPRIGYAGIVDEHLDMELLSSLAKTHPQWAFVLVGEINMNLNLSLPTNIHIIEHPIDTSLASYLKHMDIGLLPYKAMSEQNFCSDPQQLYWYLAYNLPTVSTSLPDCYMNKVWVSCGTNTEELSCLIQHFLHNNESPSPTEHSNILADHSWLVRTAYLNHELQEQTSPSVVVDYIQNSLGPVCDLTPAIRRVYNLSQIQNNHREHINYFSRISQNNQTNLDKEVLNNLSKLERIQEVYGIIQAKREKDALRIVVIVGYFGAGNFGDELLLHTLLQRITQIQNIIPVVIGSNPDNVKKFHATPALFYTEKTSIIDLIHASSAVILGPGGIIQSAICSEFHKNIMVNGQYFYLYPALLAQNMNKTAMCIGVGADYLPQQSIHPLLQRIFHLSPLIWLRDETSKKSFTQMGISTAVTYPDVSFFYAPTAAKETEQHSISSRPVLGLNLRMLHLRNIDDFISILIMMYRKGWDLSLICAEEKEDYAILSKIQSILIKNLGNQAKKRITLVPFTSIQNTLGAISHVDLMVAMRLHIGLLACQMYTPTLFLCYDDKVTSAAQLLGMEEYTLMMDQCTSSALKTKLNNMLKDKSNIISTLKQNCSLLRNQADEGYQYLQSILDTL